MNKDILIKYLNKDPEEFTKVLEKFDANNRAFIIGEIDEDTGTVSDEIIRYWNKIDEEANIPVEERTPIKIYINSNGGVLDSTLTLIDSISLSKTPVWTINIGCAYSGGFFIFISGHKRIAYPNSSFLFHEGSTGVSGNADRFDNFTDFYKKQREILKKITLKNTKITEEEYAAHKNEDWWLFVDEAIEKGIADEIASSF